MRTLTPSLLVLLLLATAPASAQPQIDLPPPDEPKRALPRPSLPGASFDLPRETQIEVPLELNGISGTAIGGYGELTLNGGFGDRPPATVGDVRRLVLYVGHNWRDTIRLYSEIEIEHAIASSTDKGEIEVEQLFVDWLASRLANVRVGLVVMPVGIVNVYHEPPTFNGVDRPETDTRIIPSTWRELGVGIFGGYGPLRWQGYLVSGFDAKGFTAEGLREGHQEGQLARLHDVGVVARLDVLPVAGADVGVSFYSAGAGQGDAQIGDVPVTLVEADARIKWRGLEARAELVNVWIGHSARLNGVLFPDPAMGDGPVSHQLRGGYLELGYDALRPLHLASGAQLIAFGRWERTDTQADVTVGAAAADRDRTVVTFGLTLRPIAELALKADYQYKTTAPTDTASGTSWHQLNAGIAFMF